MNQLCRVLLEGNIVREPKTKTLALGTQLSTFSIANNQYYKKKDEEKFTKVVSYFYIETWGKEADLVRNLKQGDCVRIVGHLKQKKWTDNDNKSHSKIYIIADYVYNKEDEKKEIEKTIEHEVPVY